MENINMIAPCGMNCSVCIGYLREKNKCPGCMSTNELDKLFHCTKCRIKYCSEHQENNFLYCSDCKKFPCTLMKKLDKRYTNKYNTSLIDNLLFIKENGVDKFVEKENKKWTCPYCDARLSIHREHCLHCGKDNASFNEGKNLIL